MLNDAELRAKYLDAEHKGIKVLMLFTHQPGGPHTTKKAIRNLDDFKGLRIRFASPTVRDLVQALGATPVGVPPTEIAEQLQKGTIDGAFMDYGGVGHRVQAGRHRQVLDRALRLRDELRPGDERGLLGEAAARPEEAGHRHHHRQGGRSRPRVGRARRAGQEGGDGRRRRGDQLPAAEIAKVRKIGAEVSEAKIREYEGKGMPARAVYNSMRSLSEKHAKTSKNFWN